MKIITDFIIGITLACLIIGLATWMVPLKESTAPTVMFRYTTSSPELSHIVKVDDVIIDYLGKPYMKVSSVSITSIPKAIILPSGTVGIVNNPTQWEVIFTAIPIDTGIVPPFITGGSMYVESKRWRKLVRVIRVVENHEDSMELNR